MIRPSLWLPLVALCLGTLPSTAQDANLAKQARKLHSLASGPMCERTDGGYVPEDELQSWTFSYVPSYADDAEKEEVTLIRIFCGAGAYNLQHAYYWYREFDGLQPLAFAEPTFDTKYEDDDLLEGKLESVTVSGMTAATILVNSEFDPETLTVTSHSLWRGIGDASSSGTWMFRDGQFALVSYDVDASYDGEVNPETLVDFQAR